MDFAKSFVFPFRTPDNYYLYDVNTNAILNINEDIFLFYKNKKKELNQDSINNLNDLLQKGYLQPNSIEKIEHSASPYLDQLSERSIQNVTLQVTQQCNLRCKYCVYSGSYLTRTHSEKTMPWEIAKRSIDFLLGHSMDTENPTIGFYGGEPLLNFKLIKKAVNYALEQFEGKKVDFGMTTNGTLFNDEILEFLEKNRFHLLISLDGPRHIHDSNRVFAINGKGTFDTIIKNIDYIKKKYRELYKNAMFNAVVSPELGASCINQFFLSCDAVNSERINLTYLSKNFLNDEAKENFQESENFLISYRREEFRTFMSKIGRISRDKFTGANWLAFEQFKSTMHTLRGFSKSLPKIFHPSGPCVPGIRKLFVDINGNFFPCERVSESSPHMRIGNISTGFDLKNIYKLLNIGQITADECKKCWAAKFCIQCCSTADNGMELCSQTRLSNCKTVFSNAEHMLKNFCVLKELNFSFENDSFID